MDASTRWETAAIRSSSRGPSGPPLPTAKRATSQTTWVTLREAEAATSVPVNTLRKWVRNGDLPSYLESDGGIALRMVDLDAIVSRAKALGRRVQPLADVRPGQTSDDQPTEVADATDLASPDEPTTADRDNGGSSEGTMIVPIDAFNKMLSQLGNLHQAGQQLAEARERAAKAETEATFLRQRLAELRSESQLKDAPEDEQPVSGSNDPPAPLIDIDVESQSPEKDTTPYWRYLTAGWADRQRLRRTKRQ